MAWDSTRPVPWQRMIREWMVYVAIMLVVLALFFRDQSLIGVVAGLLVSGPLYLGFGYVLAKLGYQRKSWGELRAQNAGSRRTTTSSTSAPAGPRPKPAPTKRTGGSTAGGRRRR